MFTSQYLIEDPELKPHFILYHKFQSTPKLQGGIEVFRQLACRCPGTGRKVNGERVKVPKAVVVCFNLLLRKC